MSARSHVEKLQKDKDFVSSLKKKLKKVQKRCSRYSLLGVARVAQIKRATVESMLNAIVREKRAETSLLTRLFTWSLPTAYIEQEEYILHQCHNRLCCNPNHFHLGRP